MEWKHKDVWKLTDNKSFTVEVTRHEEKRSDAECYDSDGGQRWCVYAYLYPNHPHFAKFDDTDRMWQNASCAMPFHGGPSYLRRHMRMKDGKPEVCSIQVGADYNHDGDWSYTQECTPEEARGVFRDAKELVEWLQNPREVEPES